MKVLREPEPIEWHWIYTCPNDGAVIQLDADDLEADLCKKPGTYWFTGSAEAAGLSWGFYARSSAACPTCGATPGRIPTEEVPGLVQAGLKAAYREENPRCRY